MFPRLENRQPAVHIPSMRKSDVTCPNCHAGYRRVELVSEKGTKGEFHCLLCDHVIEVFDGSTHVAIRLTVQPEKTFG
jgi:transposase-like protein